MTFTSIFRSVDEERKTMHGFQTPNGRKTQQQQWRRLQIPNNKMFVLQGKDKCQRWKEEGLTHKVTQQERHRGKTLKNNSGRFFGPTEGWRSVFKNKERYSTLCKAIGEHWHSVNIGTGAPGSKTPISVKKSKNWDSISTIRLSMMG